MNSNNCTVLVPLPASFVSDKSAAFARFGGSSPLAHCLRTMIAPGARIDRAVVAVAQPLMADVRGVLAAYRLNSVHVVQAEAPGTRADCLRAGLAEVGTGRYILIHDVRRPLASSNLRDRVISAMRGGSEMVVPALTMVDSVKAVDSNGVVTETVDRSTLLSAQFPRGITIDRLQRSLGDLDAGQDFDELEYSLQRGYSVDTVDGDPDAFVLEIPRDVRLAEAIVSCRLSGHR